MEKWYFQGNLHTHKTSMAIAAISCGTVSKQGGLKNTYRNACSDPKHQAHKIVSPQKSLKNMQSTENGNAFSLIWGFLH